MNTIVPASAHREDGHAPFERGRQRAASGAISPAYAASAGADLPTCAAVSTFCARVRLAASRAALAECLVARIPELAGCRLALVFLGSAQDLKLAAMAEAVELPETPQAWLEQVARHLVGMASAGHRFAAEDLPPDLGAQWPEGWPAVVHAFRLQDHLGRATGLALYLPSASPWSPPLQSQMEALHHLAAASLEQLPQVDPAAQPAGGWRPWWAFWIRPQADEA